MVCNTIHHLPDYMVNALKDIGFIVNSLVDIEDMVFESTLYIFK